MYIQKINTNTWNMKNRIGEYRFKKEISLRELSERTGISITTLTNLENNPNKDILLSNAVKISKALQVDLYELFCIKK